MTAEQIHDALTLLPADLIAETDKKRTQKPRSIPWKRYAAMAACFTLVLGCGIYCLQTVVVLNKVAGKGAPAAVQSSLRNEAALPETQAAAPAAQAPRESPAEEAQITGDTQASAASTAEEALCIDHAHTPAESLEKENVSGWCGNLSATVYLDGEIYPLSGSHAVTLTDILYRLDYSPDMLCRCMAEFTVDTEMGQGYEVNLTEYFVRFEGGQASLTIEQADVLQSVLEKLGI